MRKEPEPSGTTGRRAFRVRIALCVFLTGMAGLCQIRPVEAEMTVADLCSAIEASLRQIEDIEVHFDMEYGRFKTRDDGMIEYGPDGSPQFIPGTEAFSPVGKGQFAEGKYGTFGNIFKEKGDKAFLQSSLRRAMVKPGGAGPEADERTFLYAWNGQETTTYDPAAKAGTIQAEPHTALRQLAELPLLFTARRGRMTEKPGLVNYFREYPTRIVSTNEIIDGHRCVLVLVSGDEDVSEAWGDRYWFDMERGLCLVRHEYGGGGLPPLKGSVDIVLKEAAPGIWYPIEGTCFSRGSGGRYRARQVKANQGLPDSDFKITFPSGANVLDERFGVQYRIATGPKAVSAIEDDLLANVEAAVAELDIDPTAPAAAEPQGGARQAQPDASGPVGRGRSDGAGHAVRLGHIVIALVGLVGLVAAGLWWRRRRSRGGQ